MNLDLFFSKMVLVLSASLLVAVTGLALQKFTNHIDKERKQRLEKILATELKLARNIQKRMFARLEDSTEGVEEFLPLLVSTSTANSPGVPNAAWKSSFEELRGQIADVTARLEKQKSEIIEVSKIDPVLEATLKASIENLTKRIEHLEEKSLDKWDVAAVCLQLAGGLGVIIAIILGIIKFLHP